MLVCRDLEKLKLYEFEKEEALPFLVKKVKSCIYAKIHIPTGQFIIWSKGAESTMLNYKCLDFLYDMIKDGVIEKVEE